MKTPRHIAPILAIVVAGACLFQSCEKQGEAGTDPLSQKPDRVVVTTTLDTLLTDGRDSSLWSFQLYQAGSPFQKSDVIMAMTDLGYFRQGTARVHRAVFTTDASGRFSVYFYGDRAAGFAETLLWGDGYGVDTVRSVLLFGEANALVLEFRDASQTQWGTTDTLRCGLLRGKPDSTFVRVTVLDSRLNPLPAFRVDLDVLVNGKRPARSLYGYFSSTVKPDSIPTGSAITDALGQASDTFYSDLFPGTGQAMVQIVAQVDAGTFGRIVNSRFLLIKR
jgi:hypothetical protein